MNLRPSCGSLVFDETARQKALQSACCLRRLCKAYAEAAAIIVRDPCDRQSEASPMALSVAYDAGRLRSDRLLRCHPGVWRHRRLLARTLRPGVAQQWPSRYAVGKSSSMTTAPVRPWNPLLASSRGRIRFERNDVRAGAGPENWNLTLKKARGEWVHMLHTDDQVAFPVSRQRCGTLIGRHPRGSAYPFRHEGTVNRATAFGPALQSAASSQAKAGRAGADAGLSSRHRRGPPRFVARRAEFVTMRIRCAPARRHSPSRDFAPTFGA